MNESAYTHTRACEFCDALMETCNVTRATKAIGVTRRTVYNWRNDIPEFKAMWVNALEIGVGVLEDEAIRRGFEGVDKPIMYQGKIICKKRRVELKSGVVEYQEMLDEYGQPIPETIKEYSDTLAICLLKAHNPERFRERTQTDINVRGELDVAARLAAGRKRLGLQ